MGSKSPQKAADGLSKLSSQTRSGIVRGLQLVLDTFEMSDKEKQVLQECIDIVSGVSKYNENAETKIQDQKEIERPEEVKEVDKIQPEEEEPEKPKEEKELPQRTNPAKPSTKYIDPRRFL